MAPARVAALPIMISNTLAVVIIFDMRQPIVTPGIAAGVNIGSIQSASPSRHCTAPDDSPTEDEMSVRTTYSAAINPASVRMRVFFLLIFLFILITRDAYIRRGTALSDGALLSFVLGEDGYELTVVCRSGRNIVPQNIIFVKTKNADASSAVKRETPAFLA